MPPGIEDWNCGSLLANMVHHADDVGAGLAKNDDGHRRLAVGEAGVADVFHRAENIGHVGQSHGRAIAISNNQRLVLLSVQQLVAGVNEERILVVRKLALGRVGVGAGERGADIVEPDTVIKKLRGIDLHPHGGLGAAAGDDLAHPIDLGNFLRQDGVRGVVHAAHGNGVRSERQDHDGRIRGIDLAVGGRVGQVGGKLSGRSVDGRLHVARGSIDIAAQIELQGDGRGTELARRGHLGNAGDPAELPLQRRSHCGSHGLRTRSWQTCADRDGGELNLRQGRNRQKEVGHGACQQHGDRQQRGPNRPADEGRRDVHLSPPRPSLPGRWCCRCCSATGAWPAGRTTGTPPGWCRA